MSRLTRRKLLLSGAALATGAMASRGAPASAGAGDAEPGAARPAPARGTGRLTVPNGEILPWKTSRGFKVFHLVAEEIEQEIAPGLTIKCMGYNGRTPGPVIEVAEGDRVRIYVTNRLTEPTSVHWHGVFLPNAMDGVSGLSQRPINPGETFKYEFTMRQWGTFMYHSHYDEMTQIAMGLMGMMVSHPRDGRGRVDRDFCLMLNEMDVEVGHRRANPNAMNDFNVLTLNGASFPKTEPLVARKGDRVRIRIGNLSPMDHHPIHLHGYAFKVAGTDGGPIPAAAQWPETTVLVPVGSTRWVEFTADAPGDWAMHCHMTHHVMMQMSHGLPNMLGMDARGLDQHIRKLLPGYMTMGQTGMGGMAEMGMPLPKNSIPMFGGPGAFSYIDMGGMFTVLKVREGITSYADPGWFKNPPGTVAEAASADELTADGIDPDDV